jgi:hypothetical protein
MTSTPALTGKDQPAENRRDELEAKQAQRYQDPYDFSMLHTCEIRLGLHSLRLLFACLLGICMHLEPQLPKRPLDSVS